MKQIFYYISAAHFFPVYCKKVINWKHKLRGSNGRNNPIEFTDQDKAIISKGLTAFAKDLQTEAENLIK